MTRTALNTDYMLDPPDEIHADEQLAHAAITGDADDVDHYRHGATIDGLLAALESLAPTRSSNIAASIAWELECRINKLHKAKVA